MNFQTSISSTESDRWTGIASWSASRPLRTLTLLAMVSLTFGCGRGAPPSPPTAEKGAAPANAALPVPSFSAAEKVGMFVFAKNNQNHDQQLRDELECYNQVQQQTGIDPDSPPPQPPSSEQVQAAQQQAGAQTPEAEGGRARGAARGAVGGAVIGGIAGNAGKGAAIGATAGNRARRQKTESGE